MTVDPQQSAKLDAAVQALQHVRSNTVVGLGSGSTASLFITELGKKLADGTLSGIRGVPTSLASDQLARQAGIPLVSLADVDACDLTVDGADEIDPAGNLIKGLGGALLREKIVAQHSRKLLIVADGRKLVNQLGAHVPLPVEVIKFAHQASARFLASLGCTPTLRMASGQAYGTDNGNLIYDCRFEQGIASPQDLADTLAARAGIVEHGLFLGMSPETIVV